MILCIDKAKINVAPIVQKDVDLEDLINNCTKYYETVEEALKDNYVPLDFSTSIRSIYSNLVVQHQFIGEDTSIERRYYTNLTDIDEYIHKGYDLIMFLTSLALMHRVDYKVGFDELMLQHSQFHPIGLYNPDPTLINPIIYSHVIISDEGAEELPKYLSKESLLVPISSIAENKRGNLQALLDTIIEVKEEVKDEQCDNNN